MAVYRSDQAQVTFMTEPAAGGYVEQAPINITKTGSGVSTTLSSDTVAGTSSITVAAAGALQAGDAILIGYWHASVAATGENEVRQIEHVTSNTLYLSAPTAFYHASATDVFEIAPTTANLQDSASQYINLIPGAYETVDVPDPEMAIEGRWFLGTASKRDFFAAYSGQQTFAGSMGGFALLDGKSLRYPIGKVSSTTTFLAADNVTATTRPFAAALKKGDLYVTLGTESSDLLIVANQTRLMFGRGSTTSEVRQSTANLASGSAGTIRLDYPLQFDHAAGEIHAITAAAGSVSPATTQTIPYTHTITETVDLDSVSWNVHMLPSDEDRTKAFDRRYFGGKIGSMSISAEEGAMATGSWDSVNFLGMIHNQKTVDLTTDITTPYFADMQSIVNADVVGNFPTNEPYYFSNGEVQMFGQTIARIRSFSLTIANNEEPRYYIKKQMGRRRGPTEIREQRREYSLAVTLALPDAAAANTAQRTLFQEMLLEGNYGSAADFIRTGKKGFDVVITLTRGNVVTGFEDKITFTIPSSTAATGGNAQGAFIRTAPHNITEDNPFQVEADILFRNMSITVQDSEHYYP